MITFNAFLFVYIKAFEAYLEESYHAGIDLNFLKAALDFRDQLYISKEHERKVGLGYFPIFLLFLFLYLFSFF